MDLFYDLFYYNEMKTLSDQCIERAKPYINSSYNDNVLSKIGNFGGLFELNFSSYEEPVLVSSIDGVGTKLTFAIDFLENQTIQYDYNPHYNIGIDLVNHCVNDIAVQGANPIFFLNYFSMTKIHPSVFENLASGMSWACKQVNCPIISGEIAQMPGFYANGLYDIAGSIVGIVDKSKIISGDKIQYGDVVVGISSSGLHTNGYSLVRSALLSNHDLNSNFVEFNNKTLGEVLLEPHKCYLDIISNALEEFEIRGMAHITGGGIYENISRILPEGLELSIDWKSWKWPAIFEFIQEGSVPKIDESVMKSSFNLGIGMVFVVHKSQVKPFKDWLKTYYDEDAREIGWIHEKN